MLSLDSVRWGELRQAYGAADDVPRVIVALSTIESIEERAQLWFALWKMLWRADEVFDASYAAVPHLLALTSARALPERVQSVHLALRVELLRQGPTTPTVPADLVATYAAAIDSLPAHVTACAAEPWNAEVAQIMAAALLVGMRHGALASAVLHIGTADE